jgi:hypothetical protein
MPRSGKREIVWAEVALLERQGLGRPEIVSSKRDKFMINTRLTTQPDGEDFIHGRSWAWVISDLRPENGGARPGGRAGRSKGGWYIKRVTLSTAEEHGPACILIPG